ncbi:hypothetical protein L484_007791 [Morus notabilis]|uniref:Uncharacterized protein n=1 Tax=Morus notabilis TaxID=981085 RepID=W9RPZ6_9ROSA|nr:uncharacterized protein LOC21391183 [Morus notabilis]EXB86767.1 hypothetical protein L484_007791 [Morus notabilis]
MMMVEERAKEELRNIEAQYPNSHEYLKLELKSFIFLLQSHHHHDHLNILLNSDHTQFFPTSSPAVATQESTSNRKRKKVSENHCIDNDSDKQELNQINQSPEDIVVKETKKRRDRVELVLERARACLRKIRHLKSSLLPCSAD